MRVSEWLVPPGAPGAGLRPAAILFAGSGGTSSWLSQGSPERGVCSVPPVGPAEPWPRLYFVLDDMSTPAERISQEKPSYHRGSLPGQVRSRVGRNGDS